MQLSSSSQLQPLNNCLSCAVLPRGQQTPLQLVMVVLLRQLHLCVLVLLQGSDLLPSGQQPGQFKVAKGSSCS